MNSINNFFAQAETILDRAMSGVTPRISDRVAREFKHSGWIYHSFNGDGFEMLDILSDPSKLIPEGNSKVNFNINFNGNLRSLIPSLADNRTWQALLPVLVGIKEKGVGVGELVLPFIVPGWSYSNDGDGVYDGGLRECKNGVGSSIKPIKGGLTAKGLIDRLNKEYWNNMVPGQRTSFKEWLSEFKLDTKRSVEYFTKLYPGRPVEDLIADLNDVYTREQFNKVMGRHHLSWYQEIDGWKSLILIHQDSLNIYNIAEVTSDVFDDGIKVRAVMKRGKGTQAVPDGYSDISCK